MRKWIKYGGVAIAAAVVSLIPLCAFLFKNFDNIVNRFLAAPFIGIVLISAYTLEATMIMVPYHLYKGWGMGAEECQNRIKNLNKWKQGI